MQRWRLTYAIEILGDSPLVRHLDFELDAADLDEATILDRMRTAVREAGGEYAVLTDADEIT